MHISTIPNTTNDTKALVAEQAADTALPSENDFICLLRNSCTQNVALQSFTHTTSSSEHWFIDSGCTSHVTYDRCAFTSYTAASVVSNLDLGANSSAPIVGRSDVRLDLCMPDGSIKPCLV